MITVAVPQIGFALLALFLFAAGWGPAGVPSGGRNLYGIFIKPPR